MLELTPNKVARWAGFQGIPVQRAAELDYRLVELLATVAEDPQLGKQIAFKGGTAINKLYLGESARLSVDLDFNALGTRETVQAERKKVLALLAACARRQDPAAQTWETNDDWGLYRLDAAFPAVTGGAPITIKNEVSTIDRVPILGVVRQPLQRPEQATAQVPTLSLDELVATKLHAAYARRKGRDLYDLHHVRARLAQPSAVRKMALFYFFRRGVAFDAQAVFHNLEGPEAPKVIDSDLRPYLRAGTTFDTATAIREVKESYAFLRQTDAAEMGFLLATRYYLGGLGRKRAGPAIHEPHPLDALLAGVTGVTTEARSLTWDEIRVYGKKPIN